MMHVVGQDADRYNERDLIDAYQETGSGFVFEAQSVGYSNQYRKAASKNLAGQIIDAIGRIHDQCKMRDAEERATHRTKGEDVEAGATDGNEPATSTSTNIDTKTTSEQFDASFRNNVLMKFSSAMACFDRTHRNGQINKKEFRKLLSVLGMDVHDEMRKRLRRRIAGSAQAKAISREAFLRFVDESSSKPSGTKSVASPRQAQASLPMEVAHPRIHPSLEP